MSIGFIVIMESKIKGPLTMAVVQIKSLLSEEGTKMLFRTSSPADYTAKAPAD